MFKLTDCPIDVDKITEQLTQLGAGAVITFEGRVRDHNEGRAVEMLDYECYPELVETEAKKILDEAVERFDILKVICTHRVGKLKVSDLALFIGVSAAHRGPAYAASRFIVDEIKKRLPIWKKEGYTDGDTQWVDCRHHHGPAAQPDYSRQICLPQIGEDGQARLQNSRVLVIGAGGLGSPVLAYLVGAGVGSIGIVDDDVVDASNLHRQFLFDFDDLGKPKASLAVEKLIRLNPSAQLKAFDELLSAQQLAEVFKEYDLVLECTDDVGAKLAINDAAVTTATPVIFANVYQFEGQVLGYFPELNTPCLRCAWPENIEVLPVAACVDAGVLGPIPGILGSIQATEALKFLLGMNTALSSGALFFDGINLESRFLSFSKRSDCLARCDAPGTKPHRVGVQEKTFVSLTEARGAGYTIVDVRSEAELAESPITEVSYIHLPFDDIQNGNYELERNRLYLVVCERGQRSRIAAALLSADNYPKIASLARGLHGLRRRNVKRSVA